MLTNTEYLDTSADIWSSAVRGKFDLSDRLTLSAEASYDRSSSESHQIYFRLQPIATITPTVTFDIGAGDLGSYSINGINLADPGSSCASRSCSTNDYRATSIDAAARTDLVYKIDSGFLKSFSAGFRYNRNNSLQNPLRADIPPGRRHPGHATGRISWKPIRTRASPKVSSPAYRAPS